MCLDCTIVRMCAATVYLSRFMLSLRLDGVMTRETPSPQGGLPTDSQLARRTFVGLLGAGTLAATAGCLSQVTASEANGGDAPAVDPQLGFVGKSMETEPPVAVDHVVKARIRPRENGPVPEFFFEPTGLAVEPGAVVQFVMETPDHNVNAYHARFGRTHRVPEGVPPLSSPLLPANSYWLYRFDTEGVYDLTCAPHEQFGMTMRVVVGTPGGPGAEPVSTERPAPGEPRPPAGTAASVLSDDALAADAIVDATSVSWDDLAPESKQLKDGGH